MTKMIDLTQGNIKKQLLALAFPLLVGNILQQLYNTVDAVIIGRYLGQTAFAAVGVAGTLMNLFLFIFSGFCLGVSVLLARIYGSGDLPRFRQTAFLGALCGGAFTLLLSGAAILLLHPLLAVIQTPAQVAAYAADYLLIIYSGFFAAYCYNLFTAVLRAVGNTKAAMVVLGLAMGLNLLLDLLFVGRLGWGIRGAAGATVLAQVASALACLSYIKTRLPALFPRREDRRFDRPLLMQIASYSTASALHQSSLYIGKLLVQGAVNSLGTEIISAYTATTKIEGFANSFGDSGNTAISVFVAQNAGSVDDRRMKQGFRTGLFLMFLFSLALALFMKLTAPHTVAFMLGRGEEAALANGIRYLQIVSWFYCFCFLGNSFVGFFRGTGKGVIPIAGTILHISVRVLFSYLLADSLGLGAVAVATGLGWVLVVAFHYGCHKVQN